MTPYETKIELEKLKAKADKMALEWTPSFKSERRKLSSLLNEMEPFKLHQDEVPLIIKLVENPKYKTSKLFGGAVDLFTHDCIHVLLGRGLLPKDEAFVIGYTMGSGKNMKRWRRNLFMFFSKYFYPKEYRFGEEERFVFNMGIMAGSKCPTNLSEIKFNKYLNKQIGSLRKELKIDVDFLEKCYKLEMKCFDSKETQRLDL
tara:strand:+ start:467 stop:1072 length:606 start_codon:yes stop_codon:yes gene_type:complete